MKIKLTKPERKKLKAAAAEFETSPAEFAAKAAVKLAELWARENDQHEETPPGWRLRDLETAAARRAANIPERGEDRWPRFWEYYAVDDDTDSGIFITIGPAMRDWRRLEINAEYWVQRIEPDNNWDAEVLGTRAERIAEAQLGRKRLIEYWRTLTEVSQELIQRYGGIRYCRLLGKPQYYGLTPEPDDPFAGTDAEADNEEGGTPTDGE